MNESGKSGSNHVRIGVVRKFEPLLDQQHILGGQPAPITGVSLLFGLALLLAGRRLFWLFVGALGFITATEFISPLIAHDNPALSLGVGLVAGIAGALLAIFLQKVAVGLAGALAGAYYLNNLLEASSMHDPRFAWVSALIGAVIGALLLLFLFKWALIVFSSIVGAHLLLRPFESMQPAIFGASFVVLAIFGVMVQGRGLMRSKP